MSGCILWFRRDLRLDDNPALCAAVASGEPVVPVYILAPEEEAPWAPGAASRWWLHASLESLDASLRRRGGRLWIGRGDSLAVLRRLAALTGATQVVWNRLYDPATRERDTRVKQALRADGLRCASHNGALLHEPWELATTNGQPYRVFTPFWRAALRRLPELAAPRPAPEVIRFGSQPPGSLALDDLDLRPRIPWDQGLRESWTPGEAGALARADSFLASALSDYGERRDWPGSPATSRLSPHLHLGEMGPRRLLTLVSGRCGDLADGPAEPFVRELGWREFAHHLLYHFPHTVDAPLDSRFDDFPWSDDANGESLRLWQRGRTGIPLVDAAMRELWSTGWMHNRTRMVVASFLTKNLRLPWQAGARWFWDTLVDADLACNTLGWQWTAGCGADAAPYFRVFNPVLQGERFDPRGEYVRRWCPELARLPDKYIHQPWNAPPAVQSAAGLVLGRSYPRPCLDLAESRRAALAAWERVKVR